jgi:hypothetical protein
MPSDMAHCEFLLEKGSYKIVTGAVETSDELIPYLIPEIDQFEIPFNFAGKFGSLEKMKETYETVSGYFGEFRYEFDLLYRALGKMLLTGANILFYSKQGGIYFKNLVLDDRETDHSLFTEVVKKIPC